MAVIAIPYLNIIVFLKKIHTLYPDKIMAATGK